MTRYATMFVTSGITGFTLPGMIDDPGCVAGRLISCSPQRGPDESRRRSLPTFASLIARLFKTDEYSTNAWVSCVASTRLFDSLIGSCETFVRWSAHFCAYPAGALRPVPIAVPPMLISHRMVRIV